MKYTLTQLTAEFKRIIKGMPTCVIVQAGDSHEVISEVTGTSSLKKILPLFENHL